MIINELDYISKWCFKHGNANNVMANCLEIIRFDKEALQYFHPHHIIIASATDANYCYTIVY